MGAKDGPLPDKEYKVLSKEEKTAYDAFTKKNQTETQLSEAKNKWLTVRAEAIFTRLSKKQAAEGFKRLNDPHLERGKTLQHAKKAGTIAGSGAVAGLGGLWATTS